MGFFFDSSLKKASCISLCIPDLQGKSDQHLVTKTYPIKCSLYT